MLVLVVRVVACLLHIQAPASSAMAWRALDENTARAAPARVARPTVLVGHVLTADGRPAVGARVTSSAGGEALVLENGSFWLEVELPGDAQDLELAVRGSMPERMSARASVSIERHGGTNPAGTLLLGGGACEPSWEPTYGPRKGYVHDAFDMLVFDEGHGLQLYMAGDVEYLDASVARWDGVRWHGLGGPMTGGTDTVYALGIFDDGSGPALYAAGNFTAAGGVPAVDIARWNGEAWSALGSGTSGGRIYALATFDDGSGPALYAAGDFTSAGGLAAVDVARWDGSTWSAVGSGTDGQINALEVFDDGSGPALYAAGYFTQAGGSPANSIARWDGTAWSAVGSGLQTTFSGGSVDPGIVADLIVFEDGGQPALYVSGDFNRAGGVEARRVAKLVPGTPSTWAPAWSTAQPGDATAMAVFDDGSGPALYVDVLETVGHLAWERELWRSNGASWSVLSVEPNTVAEHVAVLHGHDDGSGSKLYVGGERMKVWNGTTLDTIGVVPARAVTSVALFDDHSGGGPAIFGSSASGVAKWTGTSWADLDTNYIVVRTQCVFDAGEGPELFVAGSVNGQNEIAGWDGVGWSDPIPTNGTVRVLNALDLGDGPALYAGGTFTSIDGIAASRIAKWDGTTWVALGAGMNSTVQALAVFDDGDGLALYAGGAFTSAGGVAANRIAKWDGASWSALGTGANGTVEALLAFDDGGGPKLYAGGAFTSIGGVIARRIARWNGASWTSIGAGVRQEDPLAPAEVHALCVMDDGGGPALFVGGDFEYAGGLPSSGIARWNGSAWSPLGSGMTASVVDDGVLAFAVTYEPGRGPALHAAGDFAFALDPLDSHIARWQGCDEIAPSIAHPEALFMRDEPSGPPGEIVTFDVTASDTQDPAPSLVCVPPSGSFFPHGTTLVTCTATDGAGNQTVRQFPVHVGLKVGQRRL